MEKGTKSPGRESRLRDGGRKKEINPIKKTSIAAGGEAGCGGKIRDAQGVEDSYTHIGRGTLGKTYSALEGSKGEQNSTTRKEKVVKNCKVASLGLGGQLETVGRRADGKCGRSITGLHRGEGQMGHLDDGKLMGPDSHKF